ncbi:hypothetical protein ABG067_006564 [Albugo candida]
MGCILVHTNYTDSSGEETASKTSSEPINIAFCAPIATLWPRNQPRSSRTSNARPQPPQTYIGGGIPGVALTEDQVDSPQFTGACAVGFQSLDGKLRWGSCSRAGKDSLLRRKENQDSFCVSDGIGQWNATLFIVLDGHGPEGAFVSHYVREEFCKHITQALEPVHTGSLCVEDVATFLRQAFEKAATIVSDRLLQYSALDISISGTTATAMLVTGEHCIFANIGDSRSVWAHAPKSKSDGSYQLVFETQDHKPDLEPERMRIEASQGRVFEWGSYRVWIQDIDMPGLAMSRSFGDGIARTVGVISVPDVTCLSRLEDNRPSNGDVIPRSFVILASDGVWEFMTSEECVVCVSTCILSFQMTPQETCDTLVAEAIRRWEEEEDVIDDVTAIVIYL